MQIGFWQIAIVIALVVLLFGRGKISELMGDVAKGIKSFKKGLSDEILNQRIEAQKKYKIEATPTIFINGKEYTGKVNYKEFKKTLEKNF